ncbi:hypothetical protein P12x_000374 [Tundrisphaera lichenicola]|uniref:hypothetical protein n=1 Tax=Tundrisphaera lichenicola TaxID=2029860 RepID=UPI003EB714F5
MIRRPGEIEGKESDRKTKKIPTPLAWHSGLSSTDRESRGDGTKSESRGGEHYRKFEKQVGGTEWPWL